jgi:NAD(P)-dependent dehydrogenase (short-subunit alcohol dehydrogenase family)
MMDLFSLEGRVAVVTGGGGALGGAMARGLASAGARVAVVGRTPETLQRTADAIAAAGGECLPVAADVLDEAQLAAARDAVLSRWGRVDVLVNAAGGNVAEAVVPPDGDVFGIPTSAFRRVFDLNLYGTVLPTQVFGPSLAAGGEGSVINVSSMAADRAITRVSGYSAAKAAVDNYTRWLAVELGRRHGTAIRVNAVAPGFFLGEQNRRLLTRDDGTLTDRGRTIVSLTPAGRFGEADELVGTVVWLASRSSRFVTGVVVPVDGGFSAWSGV